MKRYLVLALTASLLLPLLVVPAVTAKRRAALPLPKTPATTQPGNARQVAGAPISVQASAFAETIPVRDMPEAKIDFKASRFLEERNKNERNEESIRRVVEGVHDKDGALQQDSGRNLARQTPNVLPTPTIAFDGISGNDNNNAGLGRFSPPDPNGDVGPNHYVQTTNVMFAVYNKTTGAVIKAPALLSTLFSALGTVGNRNDGDPITLYDPMADRWLISQFSFPNGDTTAPFYQVIAISKTPDPTGAYYLYGFALPGTEFNDYPHFGVWPDGYYMTDNQFNNGASFDGTGVFAFNRAKMLAGDPTANFIYFNLNLTSHPEAIGGMLPADVDGFNPPPLGSPCPFAYFTATEFGDPADGMRVFDFHADYTTPANSTFIERPESAATSGGGIPVAAFDPSVPGTTRDNVPQPSPAGTTAQLDAIADRLMFRLAYRNLGTKESLVVTHSVDADATAAYRSGIRYYEFARTTPGSGAWTVNEQATYAGPANDTTHRWMGSAAMNAAGDIAVGYSASSTSVFPSARYAARFASDAPNGLQQGEQILTAGTGVQTGTGSRWGDYASLSVDPSDDCTFWYTGEYYTAAGQASSSVGWSTRIAKFNLGSQCTAAPKGIIQGTVTNAQTGLPVANAVITTSNGFIRTTDANGNYSIDPIAVGSYNMTASAPTYPNATANGISVSNGQTVIQNFVLTGSPIIQPDGAQLITESCPNNALDPGETVTMNLSLKNIGSANTVALLGALQSTGNVTNPPAAQSFGALIAGGPSVTVPYTFKVSQSAACGDNVTPTLVLTDGLTNLGNAVYTIQTGVLAVSLSEAFDTVTAPALPAGYTTAHTGALADWVTSTTNSSSAPNNAFSNEVTTASSSELVTPAIPINASNAQLTFKNLYNLEASSSSATTGFDGMVLEISIPSVNAGAFQDILTAGGSFSAGGYTRTISTSFSNPLAGRQAWSGLSGGTTAAPTYITTTVNLPASANGQSIKLKWRRGDDSSLAASGAAGARVDNIVITGARSCCTVSILPLPDLTGDGKADIAVFHPLADNSGWLIRNSLTGIVSTTGWGIGTGVNPDKPVPADYDGDNKLDVAVWRPTDGNWYILGNPAGAIGWGQLGDVPIPADYDGDKKADIAVFRPSEGNWYIRNSTGGVTVQGWGNATDKLVPADYDGDGKADIAIYRPTEGNWYIRKSTGGVSVIGWGNATDTPVPGDYDGDKKADIAVFRGTEGNWYIQKSTGGSAVSNWGNGGDTPVPADYDGDNKVDIAVYRATEGNWYIVSSQTNLGSVLNLGVAGDSPISTGIYPH